MNESLTRQQLKLLVALYKADVAGLPASVRDLVRATGVSSTNGVFLKMKIIARKGFIRWTPGTARTLQITAIPFFAGDPAKIVDFIPRGAPRMSAPLQAVEGPAPPEPSGPPLIGLARPLEAARALPSDGTEHHGPRGAMGKGLANPERHYFEHAAVR